MMPRTIYQRSFWKHNTAAKLLHFWVTLSTTPQWFPWVYTSDSTAAIYRSFWWQSYSYIFTKIHRFAYASSRFDSIVYVHVCSFVFCVFGQLLPQARARWSKTLSDFFTARCDRVIVTSRTMFRRCSFSKCGKTQHYSISL